jgi:hypothetical protein
VFGSHWRVGGYARVLPVSTRPITSGRLDQLTLFESTGFVPRGKAKAAYLA